MVDETTHHKGQWFGEMGSHVGDAAHVDADIQNGFTWLLVLWQH